MLRRYRPADIVSDMEPPVADRRPVTTTHHGRTRVDEYEWLRAKDDPEVAAYLEAENAYTEDRTAHLKDLRQAIFDEIKARTLETDLSVPTRNRGYWYYGRTFEGREYGASCRVPIRGEDDWTPPQPAEECAADEPALPGEELMLDLNVLAEGHDFFSLGGSSVSPDTTLLAYSTDTTGDERYTVRIKDLAHRRAPRGRDHRHPRRRHLDPRRPGPLLHDRRRHLARRTRSGGTASAPSRPTTSWSSTRTDGRFWVGVGRSRTDRFLVIASGAKTTTEYRFLDADRPDDGFRVFAPRREGLEYGLEHAVIAGEDVFLVLHNNTGPDFEIGTAPVEPTEPEDWRPLVPHDPAVRLEEVDAFAGHLVVHQRSDGLTQLRIIELGDDGVGRRLPRGVRRGDLHRRLRRQPVVHPAQGPAGLHVAGDPVVGLRLRRPHPRPDPAPAYPRPGRLRPRRLRGAPALGDRRRRRAGPDLDRRQARLPRGLRAAATRPVPVLLYGYGAYEMSIDPYFSVARLSLLDRGAAFAIAHVRGGGEMGRRWYDNGKKQHKQNSFGDFVACARHLAETGWTTPELTIAEGASAGGLLMGAIANQAPEAFGGVVAGVPFVDSLTTMLDATPAADRPGVRGVGQPRGGRRGLRLPRVVRAVRQRRGGRLPADPGRDVLPRHPGPVRRAREVDRPAPGHGHRTPRLPAQDRDGGRPRRRLGTLQVVARPGVRPRLDPRPDGAGRGPPLRSP